jgi:hypothetical protein
MEREEAQHILSLCRPHNEEDRNDPLIAQALALLKHDAELRAWFEEQQARDTQISDSLGCIEPPADLKASILAGMRLHQAQAEATSADTILFSEASAEAKKLTKFSPWMGIAVLFAVLFFIVAIPRSNETQLASNDAQQVATAGAPDFIQFLADEIDGLKPWGFDKKDEQANRLQSYLASSGMPNPAQIPSKLNAMPTIGCVTFDFGGAKLSMICFKGKNVYHLITADKASLNETISENPAIYEFSGQAFKVWPEGEQVLILSVRGTKADIPDFI